MAKKNFDDINTQDIYSKVIAEATQEAPAAQEKPAARKARKTYKEAEAAEFLHDIKTAGRKGVKLPRVNLAFAPDIYDYVKTMSKASGLTYTEFINKILRDHKEAHEDIYKKAVEIRNSI